MSKYFIILGLLLVGCSGGNSCNVPSKEVSSLPPYIKKFKDGEVVCYESQYSTAALSCVFLPEEYDHDGNKL